jgi:hypothetical protein
MSLFAPTAMTYDRIARTNRASANDRLRGGLRPIGSGLARRRGKCDKDNRGNGALFGGDLAEIPTQAEPSPPSKISDWKRISNPRKARYFHEINAHWPVNFKRKFAE